MPLFFKLVTSEDNDIFSDADPNKGFKGDLISTVTGQRRGANDNQQIVVTLRSRIRPGLRPEQVDAFRCNLLDEAIYDDWDNWMKECLITFVYVHYKHFQLTIRLSTGECILPVLAFQADRDFPKIIHHMAAAALGTTVDEPAPSKGDVVDRLLPNFC